MNAERLAEIRELAKRAPWGSLPMVNELIGHIAQLEARITGLEFANGVLDSAAKDAQAWQYEAQTAKEAYTELLEANRVTEAEGGAVAQLNRMVDELRAQLEAQRGGAVVVAELTDKEIAARFWSNIPDSDEAWYKWALRDYRWVYALAVSRIQPIPADRVLADGMVGVDRKGLQDVYEALAYSQPSEPSIDPHSNSMAHRRALGFCADALRSQAGGEG